MDCDLCNDFNEHKDWHDLPEDRYQWEWIQIQKHDAETRATADYEIDF